MRGKPSLQKLLSGVSMQRALSRAGRCLVAGALASPAGLMQGVGARGLHIAGAGGFFTGIGVQGRRLGMVGAGEGARAMSIAKSNKETTWYGMRRSLDPTAPSVIRRRPTTPSQRHTAMVDKTRLFRGQPEKSLTVGLRNKGGRDSRGKLTVRGIGGGNKRVYRIIDFQRSSRKGEIVVGKIERIEYDPNRSAFICLLKHDVDLSADGLSMMKPKIASMSYILCPKSVAVGNEVKASKTEPLDIQVGNAMQLRHIPVGTKVHNVEISPGKGGTFARSAGTSAQVLERDEEKNLALLRMQSKEVRYVHLDSMATVGEVSNPEWKNEVWGKAGRARWFGRRPKVRGVAMNPHDHPHGGGEGKKHAGRHPVTPWGIKTKGFKTVRKLSPLIRLPRWKAKLKK